MYILSGKDLVYSQREDLMYSQQRGSCILSILSGEDHVYSQQDLVFSILYTPLRDSMANTHFRIRTRTQMRLCLQLLNPQISLYPVNCLVLISTSGEV